MLPSHMSCVRRTVTHERGGIVKIDCSVPGGRGGEIPPRYSTQSFSEKNTTFFLKKYSSHPIHFSRPSGISLIG